LTLNNQLEAEKDVLPLPYLFREFDEMPKLEKDALNLCHGAVLDIGCGAGSHSLYLQNKGLSITALDASKGAIASCKLRGVKKNIHSKIADFNGQRFDTLLLLMNGIGIAGTLLDLNILLAHLKTLLKPGGQILLDSSDIIYMFDENEDEGYSMPVMDSYYGEVTFRMEYKQKSSASFKWLYVDYKTLQKVVHAHNFNCELVSEGNHYDYLVRISSK
jgi:SAM-dependent methyltransferase